MALPNCLQLSKSWCAAPLTSALQLAMGQEEGEGRIEGGLASNLHLSCARAAHTYFRCPLTETTTLGPGGSMLHHPGTRDHHLQPKTSPHNTSLLPRRTPESRWGRKSLPPFLSKIKQS